MRKEDLSIDTTFDPCWFSLDYTFKGTVQRKLTGVESDINRKVFLTHWTADISFLNVKGTCSLNSKKPVSAAKAKICGLSNSMGRPLQITDSGKPTSTFKLLRGHMLAPDWSVGRLSDPFPALYFMGSGRASWCSTRSARELTVGCMTVQ